MATSTTLQIRLDDETIAAVECEAKSMKITKSVFVRNIIKSHLNNSSVMIDTLIDEQAQLSGDMAEVKGNLAALTALLPIIFAMVKVATYSDELKEKMSTAADVGREIMKKAREQKS